MIEGQVLGISPSEDENGNIGWSNVWFQEKPLDKHHSGSTCSRARGVSDPLISIQRGRLMRCEFASLD